MKKSTLALSVAAAIGSFGFIGNAMAIGEFGVGFNLAPNGTAPVTAQPVAATIASVNTDGIGHQLIVPYFSAQGANATLLNITNTDTINGKLVKVRFRGAANSDDLFDFTLLLSPGDVWTGSVSQDPTTGLSLMRTTDTSCALPTSVKSASGQVFSTGRVDPTPAKGSMINETREGYVEIITMADIPPIIVTTAGSGSGSTAIGPVTIPYVSGSAVQQASSLYGTIKHVSRVAPCSPGVLSARVGSDPATVVAANSQGLAAPTGTLAADWVILNQTTTAAWSGSAVALRGNGATNLAFWPQKDIAANAGAGPLLAQLSRNGQINAGTMAATADPLFTSGAVTIQPFDLPDLSTPMGTETAAQRANQTSALLAVTSITNGFVTNSGIAGVTDFLMSQPTRRYSVAVNYTAAGTASAANDLTSGGTRAAAIYRGHVANNVGLTDALFGTGSIYYGSGNTSVAGRQVCLNSIATPTFFDREEEQVPGGFVISPNTAIPFSVCGETAVVSINSGGTAAGSAVSATVVRNDITFASGFDLGFATFSTTGGNPTATATGVGPVGGANPFVSAATALPIVGSAFVRLANGAVNYGFTTAHKVTR